MNTATPLIPRRQAKSESNQSASLQSDQFVADKQGTQQYTPRISADSAVKEEVEVAIEVESKQDVPVPIKTTSYQPDADGSHGNTEQDIEVSLST